MFTRIVYFDINCQPFKKKEVRQAINYAVDRELIIKKLLKDKAFLATSWLPTRLSQPSTKTANPTPYDPKKAKELMAKAGYPNGFAIDQAIGTGNERLGGNGLRGDAALPQGDRRHRQDPADGRGRHGGAATRRANSRPSSGPWARGRDILGTLKRFHSETSRAGGNYGNYKKPEFDKLL